MKKADIPVKYWFTVKKIGNGTKGQEGTEGDFQPKVGKTPGTDQDYPGNRAGGGTCKDRKKDPPPSD